MKKRFWNGISVKIVFVFILFLVPVYILLFVSVKSYINSLQTMAVNSADKLLEINLNSLYAEIDSVDQFIYDMQETNTEYINLCEWKGTGMNYVSLYAVNKELIDRKASWQFVDALYVYVEQPDALMLVSTGYDRLEKNLLKTVIMENHLADRNLKWQIRTIDGNNYFVHSVGYYGVWAGVLIDMDVFMEHLENQIGYTNTIVTVDAVRNPTCPGNYLMVSPRNWLYII